MTATATTYTVDYVRRIPDGDGGFDREVERQEFSSKEEVLAFAEEYFRPGILNAYGVGFAFGRLGGLRAFVGDEPAFDVPDPYAAQL